MNCQFDLATYLADLKYLVNIDSGTGYPEGVAKVAAFFEKAFAGLGWQVQAHRFDPAVGPCLEVTNSSREDYDVLLIGHTDTVFPAGTAAERPFTIRDGKAFGPGVNDMKAGLLLMYYALGFLHREKKLGDISLCVALNSDEEISSRYSRQWLEKLSRRSRYALILEPARADGNLVNKRKGVGRYKIEIAGVAAHSGVDPEKGCSAIQELAHWILALHEKTDFATGTTVNVGLAAGGTAVNVIADKARAEVDTRFFSLGEADGIEAVMRELVDSPKTAGVKAKVSGGVTRPPMMPSDETLRLCREIERIGQAVGVKVGWTTTGGGSDGCFSASLGVPTIDGLGPVGGGSHGIGEYVIVGSIAPRYDLLRAIIEYLAAKG